jgi:hypothetical protein
MGGAGYIPFQDERRQYMTEPKNLGYPVIILSSDDMGLVIEPADKKHIFLQNVINSTEKTYSGLPWTNLSDRIRYRI